MAEGLTDFYLLKEEPVKSCLLALRQIILNQHPEVSTKLSYGMPFFYFRNKRFCYLWTDKKTGQPYLGIVEGKLIHHPDLLQENSSKMKILPIHSALDLPVAKIQDILKLAISICN